MLNTDDIEKLVRDLPDAEGARLFFERITTEHPREARLLARDEGLRADALALAAWSPLLATTLAQNPEYLSWLGRERTLMRVKALEEFGESLARFALTHSQLDAQVLLARFRRRELLRIYLRDIRRASTIVETTEELSNLADAVLQYALGLAQQELDNLYGSPQLTDARGRTAPANFSVVALGKLGSRELNYASDIDLMFLYSDEGQTSGKGVRDAIGNREYFGKLAERIARTVGQPSGEGAAYRVDLRLRPHGRDGALACSIDEARRYYRATAQPWELQALIRARASAGSQTLYARFAAAVRERIYRADATVAQSLADVRLAKQKIDRHHRADTGGFNVKLGRGGIREIEFIAQALQLAYGGRDAWLHTTHTLISLGRLADRGFITERERTELSDAYAFLRTLEHRLQMEHGLQTHIVPDADARRSLVARRMSFAAPDALDAALRFHTANVRAAYERIFDAPPHKLTVTTTATTTQSDDLATTTRARSTSDGETLLSRSPEPSAPVRSSNSTGAPIASSSSTRNAVRPRLLFEPPTDAETAAATTAANLLAPRLAPVAEDAEAGTKFEASPADVVESVTRHLREAAAASINPRRALTLTARVAASLDKSDAGATAPLARENLSALVKLCGASEFFGDILAANPALIAALNTSRATVAARDHRALLRSGIDREKTYGAELSALRRGWAHLLVEIGACDARGEITSAESNELQTALAAAAINVAFLVARRELARRYGDMKAGPRLVVLGLGRLGSLGMDYGSDLDIVIVYDERVASPVAALTHDEAYARLVELLTATLSSVTRDGYLYRVDMRLRPDGKNGAVAMSATAFVNYLRDRASIWEWLAYVKLRAVAGDLEFGATIEANARRVIHQAARVIDPQSLRVETRRVRERLERERTTRTPRAVDIKYGQGGMLDVYFAARFLQLRDDVPDTDQHRSTLATLRRLHAARSFDNETFRALADGYALLRSIDHALRIIVGRSTRLPAQDHPALRDLARRAAYDSPAALLESLAAHMHAVRAAYDRITGQP